MSRTPTPRPELVAAAKAGITDDDSLFVQKGLIPDTVEAMDDRRCRFVISTGAVDRDNDTISPDGWDLGPFQRNPVVLWAHDYKQLPVARALSVTMANGQLVSDCEFADHPFAETVYRLIKGGFLKATSVGFRPKLWNFNEERGGIDFAKQELMEYSIVPVPANPEALIDMRAAKAAGIDVEPLMAWAKSVLADSPAETPTLTHTVDASSTFAEPFTQTIEGTASALTLQLEPEPLKATIEVDVQIKTNQDDSCRVCNQKLETAMPRLRDDLGIVCAPCFMRAALPSSAAPPADAAPLPTKEAEIVLDFDDAPREDIAVELTEEEEILGDLSPVEIRAALRSAVTSAVSTLVRDETRAALNRARGRVD